MKNKNLQYYISTFLTTYIGGERGLSENTFLSYNKTFKLLVTFLCNKTSKSINKLNMDDFTSESIAEFLCYIEDNGSSIATRNQRLAAIRSFCKYVQFDSPQYMFNMQQILNIKSKKTELPVIQYLSSTQLKQLLEEPDSSNKYGFKDLVILTTLADTGMRVSEFINVKVSDVRLTHPAQILVHGKGKKDRWTPLSNKARDLLKLYMEKEKLLSVIKNDQYLFLNRSKRPFTRAGIKYILQKYTALVHEKYPMDFPESLSPHCLRHTKAMLLLEAGQNLIYIRDILGHEHIKTTEIYARVNSKQLRTAIESVGAEVQVPDKTTIDYQNNPELLSWLLDYSS